MLIHFVQCVFRVLSQIVYGRYQPMGLLPDPNYCGLRMRRECRERFPRHRGLAIPCATHVPWCMSGLLTSGFIWSRWRGKRSRHSPRMRNPHICVSGKRPMRERAFSLAGWDIDHISSVAIYEIRTQGPVSIKYRLSRYTISTIRRIQYTDRFISIMGITVPVRQLYIESYPGVTIRWYSGFDNTMQIITCQWFFVNL